MSVHPQGMPTTPEGKVWDKLGDMHRRILSLERATASQVQKFAYNYPAAALVDSPQVLSPAFTVNIPDGQNSRCFFHMYWRQFSINNNTSTWEMGMRDIDPSTGLIETRVSTIANSIAQGVAETVYQGWTTGNSVLDGQDVLAQLNAPYSGMTPGDHVIRPYAKRTSGTGLASWANLWIFAVVL